MQSRSRLWIMTHRSLIRGGPIRCHHCIAHGCCLIRCVESVRGVVRDVLPLVNVSWHRMLKRRSCAGSCKQASEASTASRRGDVLPLHSPDVMMLRHRRVNRGLPGPSGEAPWTSLCALDAEGVVSSTQPCRAATASASVCLEHSRLCLRAPSHTTIALEYCVAQDDAGDAIRKSMCVIQRC